MTNQNVATDFVAFPTSAQLKLRFRAKKIYILSLWQSSMSDSVAVPLASTATAQYGVKNDTSSLPAVAHAV